MVENALRLDQSLAEAHATQGGILTWNNWEWDQAQSALLRAIELNPNCASAHFYYAELLEVTNSKEEAREQLNYAIELDPLFFWYHLVSSIFYYYDGRYQESLVSCKNAEEMNPEYDGIHRQFFHIYYKMGEDDKAAASFQRVLLCHPDSTFRKQAKKASDIYKERGIEGLLNWKIGLEAGRNKPLTLFIASSYALLGEKELALIRLEEAMNTHCTDLPWINVDPDFGNLRSEPRFQELIRKLMLSDFHPAKVPPISY
jgi:tetratricopeptide (TPR) repeat protein